MSTAVQLWAAVTAALLTYGHGHHVGPQQDLDPPRRFVADLDVHVNLGVSPGLLGRRLTLGKEKAHGGAAAQLCHLMAGLCQPVTQCQLQKSLEAACSK